jgi:replication fork clamp-binding protein CrfC
MSFIKPKTGLPTISIENTIYINTVNHPSFKKANQLVHSAEKLLYSMGLSEKQSREWIYAWASGAGGGSQ